MLIIEFFIAQFTSFAFVSALRQWFFAKIPRLFLINVAVK
jgi:hypothetical protein